jgi:hypothetical protein
VLELGAGTGVCGLLCAKYGAYVDLTDVAGVIPLLQTNIAHNCDSAAIDQRVRALELNWMDPSTYSSPCPAYDFIIASEVLFSPKLYDPFLRTICAYAGVRSVLLIAYVNFVEEFDECPFWNDARATFGIVEIALRSEEARGCQVYKLTRKDCTL